MQFRETIDDAKMHVVAKLNLHHFSGKVVTHLSDFLKRKPYLAPTPCNQVIDQESGQKVDILLAGMFAKIENLSHGESSLLLLGTHLVFMAH